MKNIITIFLAFISFSCKSQTVSLETAAQCSETNPCSDYSYAKDINNTLNKYVGTWKGTHNGRVYEIKFNKSLYEDFTGFKRDQLSGRLRIATVNLPITIFDNFNESNDSQTNFTGLNFQPDLKSYRMIFAGPVPSGCINHGTVYLRINPGTPNQMRIYYWSDKDIVVGECPITFSQTFPEKQEIFLTRQ